MSEYTTKEECRANVNLMTQKIDEIKDHVGDKIHGIELLLAKLPEQLRKEFDTRYASKRIEKNVDKLIWLVVCGVVLGALNLVLR